MGASAAARRGAEGGYEEEARHIIRVIGRDVFASSILSSLSVVVHRGALVFLDVERDRGLRAPGAEKRTVGVWLRR